MKLVYKKVKHSSVNGTGLLNDHINCIIILLLLVELYHIKRNTANLKYFYCDLLTGFYNAILAAKQSIVPLIVVGFVNIWDPTMCTTTDCTFNMVCELA